MSEQTIFTNDTKQSELPKYETPTLTTYDEQEIIEELGPAQANEYDLGTSLGF